MRTVSECVRTMFENWVRTWHLLRTWHNVSVNQNALQSASEHRYVSEENVAWLGKICQADSVSKHDDMCQNVAESIRTWKNAPKSIRTWQNVAEHYECYQNMPVCQNKWDKMCHEEMAGCVTARTGHRKVCRNIVQCVRIYSDIARCVWPWENVSGYGKMYENIICLNVERCVRTEHKCQHVDRCVRTDHKRCQNVDRCVRTKLFQISLTYQTYHVAENIKNCVRIWELCQNKTEGARTWQNVSGDIRTCQTQHKCVRPRTRE